MKAIPPMCAALVATLLPAAALADNPYDPTMRNSAARARDREQTRQLNLGELNRVRARDAREMRGWRAARAADDEANTEYAAGSQHYRQAMADYARERAQYEREMAEWRRAVAACRVGDYSACE